MLSCTSNFEFFCRVKRLILLTFTKILTRLISRNNSSLIDSYLLSSVNVWTRVQLNYFVVNKTIPWLPLQKPNVKPVSFSVTLIYEVNFNYIIWCFFCIMYRVACVGTLFKLFTLIFWKYLIVKHFYVWSVFLNLGYWQFIRQT